MSVLSILLPYEAYYTLPCNLTDMQTDRQTDRRSDRLNKCALRLLELNNSNQVRDSTV